MQSLYAFLLKTAQITLVLAPSAFLVALAFEIIYRCRIIDTYSAELKAYSGAELTKPRNEFQAGCFVLPTNVPQEGGRGG
jgi:hypothetical protein